MTELDEPEEGDYISFDGGHKWYIVGEPRQDERPVIDVDDDPDAASFEEVLRKHADNEMFWPNAWLVSDHGNTTLFKY